MVPQLVVVGTSKILLFDHVGHVKLGDVNPVLLRDLDEDPDGEGGEDNRRRAEALRVPAQADALIEEEEALEGIGEEEEQGPHVQQLEKEHAHDPVVEEEPAHVDRVEVGPVAERGEVLDGKVVDVERLVVALVASEGKGGEGLKDRLVHAVDDQRGDARGQGVLGDRQRRQQARANDDDENGEAARFRQGPGPFASPREQWPSC